LHLASVFAYFWGNAKSKPAEHLKNNNQFLSPRRLGLTFFLPGEKSKQKTPRRLCPSSILGIEIHWFFVSFSDIYNRLSRLNFFQRKTPQECGAIL